MTRRVTPKGYWDIGRPIDIRQSAEGWGAAVIPRLATELKNELPELNGFSERNIKRMLAFYRTYPDPIPIVLTAVAQLTPSANLLLTAANSGKSKVQPTDNPSIGLILCQERNQIIAEYSLRRNDAPIGISEYELTRALPTDFVSSSSTVEQIEQELADLTEVPVGSNKPKTKPKPTVARISTKKTANTVTDNPKQLTKKTTKRK